MTFAEVATTLDPATQWAAVITVVALAVTAVANVILQVLARFDAAKVAAQAKADAAKAQGAASVAAEATKQVKQTLANVGTLTALKLNEVSTALAESTASAASTADETLGTVKIVHGLVNNAMGLALSSNAHLARKIADMTGHVEDVRTADLAEAKLAEHNAKQAQVDAISGDAGPIAASPSADMRSIRADIARVPEQTAVRVVQKIEEHTKESK